MTQQDVGKLQSAGEVFGKGGPCDAEVTGGGALDFPDEVPGPTSLVFLWVSFRGVIPDAIDQLV